jgi:hypothetical protein
MGDMNQSSALAAVARRLCARLLAVEVTGVLPAGFEG